MKSNIRIVIIGLILALLILNCLVLPVSANSIKFSGLGQVNKTINVFDLNEIASGESDGYKQSINNSDLFYYTPGHSYNFQINPLNTTTYLSDAPTFMNFFFEDEKRLLAIISLIVLSLFAFMLLGGCILLYFYFRPRRA
jgi:hypothetical protein